MWRTPTLVLVLAWGVLTAAAALRSAEYDEQYTMFLTAGTPRPVWPDHPIRARDVIALQTGHAAPRAIAQALRATDVHPPLYFWAVAGWRDLGMQGLFETRLLSVGFSLLSLVLVGVVAHRTGVPVALSMLLTVGCYGFTYTGSVARGFALAQLFVLGGIACALRRPSRRRHPLGLSGGLLLGGATLANYLAIFPAVATLFAVLTSGGRIRGDPWKASRSIAGFALFLPAGAWFYLAQKDSRGGQFPDFGLLATLERLARFGLANLVGGLPLYVHGAARQCVSIALILLIGGLAALTVARWSRIGFARPRRLLLLVLVAPPLGLLALGVAFNTTAIELRYLSFSTPMASLLLAGAIGSLRRPAAFLLAATVLTVQAASLAGLMTRPETMQPARRTAQAAAALVGDGIVLLPRGNDGVGIVGAFAREAPAELPLLIVGPSASIEGPIAGYRRVTLALMTQDTESRATALRLTAWFQPPVWRRIGQGFDTMTFERTDREGVDENR